MVSDPRDTEGWSHPVWTETVYVMRTKPLGSVAWPSKRCPLRFPGGPFLGPQRSPQQVALAALLTFVSSSLSFWKPTLTPRLG